MNAYQRVLGGRYVDSVVLMRLAQSLAQRDGIEDAAALMGTDANKALLREGAFLNGGVTAGPNDLIVAVRTASRVAAETALASVDELLARRSGSRRGQFATLEAAVDARPASNVAVISVPGEYAAPEARRALELGLHVFLFSSNVALDDELELKALALARGLLCMGPDCGTSIIGGKGLGFANAVRRGPVGIVGASGTGIQVLSTLLDSYGVGVSHALGCGSRDLSAAVGGATASAALDALLRDQATEAIVLISKPASPEVEARLREQAEGAEKPVVFGFLGDPTSPPTLVEVAREAVAALGRPLPPLPALPEVASRGGFIRGLYAGGTLAYEAQLVLRAAGVEASSNAPLPGAEPLRDAARSVRHTILDLGSEELTHGRAHPMIDARIRAARLEEESADPRVALILLDVVLGYGAAPDPAGDLVAAIAEARRRGIVVLAYVCGTPHDPQGLATQQQKLLDAGAILAPTSSAMVEAAAQAVGGVRR